MSENWSNQLFIGLKLPNRTVNPNTMPDFSHLLSKTFYAFFGKYPALRPAQEKAMPLILEGQNVVIISPTGSGKTEAVIAPTCELALAAPGEVYCLYICPTRALVNDIERRIEGPLNKLQMKVGVRHGDRKTLRGKTVPNILLTTPESLDVVLGSKQTNDRERLRGVRTVIIDEVHQFYQTHRGYQLILLLERLKRLTQAPLQRLLLSATVAQPQKMAQWFQGSDRSFEIVQIPGVRALNMSLNLATALDGREFQQGKAIVDLITPILEDHKKVLMFANSRNECDWLYWKLHDQLGVETLLHYSTLNKEFREKVEHRFQKTHRAFCIATSTLELGIDIGDVDAVVMYGVPASISSFVQRIGRGNRRSDTCTIYGFCRDYHIDGTRLGAEHDLIMFYALVASMLDSELEIKPDVELFSVHVQQFFSLAYQYESVIVDILKRVIEKAETSINSFASQTDLENVLSTLSTAGFFNFRPHVKAYYPAEKWERVKNSLQLWGNIPSKFQDTVIDTEEAVPISEIPSGKAKPGQVFLFAGVPRLVTEVTGSLVRTSQLLIDDPRFIVYETAGAATPPEVAKKALELLQASTFPNLPIYPDESLINLLRIYRKRFRGFNFNDCIPFEQIEKRYCYYTFAGTWANELLAMALRKEGMSVEVDSWRFYTNRPIESLAKLPINISALQNLVQENLSALIRRIQFSYHFYQLPENLQLREIYSLIDLPGIREWIAVIQTKSLVHLE
jgi:ATP-dependent Lhr-like helicase